MCRSRDVCAVLKPTVSIEAGKRPGDLKLLLGCRSEREETL